MEKNGCIEEYYEYVTKHKTQPEWFKCFMQYS